MYHFSYIISPEDYREVVRWQVYGERNNQTLWEKAKTALGKVFLFFFLSIALSAVFGPVPAVILVGLGFLIFSKTVLFHLTYWRNKRSQGKADSGFNVPIHVTFDETGILYECGGMAVCQIYASLLQVVGMENFLRVDGKKGTFLIPKESVGNSEDIEEFKSFLKDKIEENRQQIYRLKKVKEEVAEKYPYTYYFTRTVDELINSEAEASPVSFLSKWYWTPARILIWSVTVLFLAVVVFVTWRTGRIVAWTIPLLVVLEIIYVGIISRSNFKKRRKRLLKQRSQMVDSELVGHQMMAFGEEKFTIFTEYGYMEKPWEIVGFLNDNGRDLRFVLRGGRCFLLPRKVFGTEEELKVFKDYCDQCIETAAGSKNAG